MSGFEKHIDTDLEKNSNLDADSDIQRFCSTVMFDAQQPDGVPYEKKICLRPVKFVQLMNVLIKKIK